MRKYGSIRWNETRVELLSEEVDACKFFGQTLYQYFKVSYYYAICIREHCYMTHNVIGSSLPDAYILPATAYTNDANLLWYRSCVPLHKGDTILVINPLTLLRWIDEIMYIIGWIGEC